jgi:hypothetical protein
MKVKEIQSRGSRTAIILLILLLGYGCGSQPTVPATLIGEWKTESPDYEGRSLVITRDQIVFGVGGGEVDVKRIQRIDETREEDHILYVIYYSNPGEPEYQLTFYYEFRHGGVIRFKNQYKMEWTKGGA